MFNSYQSSTSPELSAAVLKSLKCVSNSEFCGRRSKIRRTNSQVLEVQNIQKSPKGGRPPRS